MSANRLLLAAVLALTLVVHAYAQKNELAGLVRRTFISNQGVNEPKFRGLPHSLWQRDFLRD